MDQLISIVIPAYNEAQRLGATLEQVCAYVSEQHWRTEVLVVNDGSKDETAELVRQYSRRFSVVRLVENPGNRGKGFSVRNGMLNARGDVLLFSDADLSAPISEAPKLLAAIAAGADVAIGSRWMKSELQSQRQPFHRQIFGRVYNLLMRAILGLNYKDTQCGFKAFTRRAAREIFPAQRIERWGFDPEILFLAKHFGFKVAEVPVRWGHEGESHIHPVRDGIQMFREMLSIRWTDVKGDYQPAAKRAATHAAK